MYCTIVLHCHAYIQIQISTKIEYFHSDFSILNMSCILWIVEMSDVVRVCNFVFQNASQQQETESSSHWWWQWHGYQGYSIQEAFCELFCRGGGGQNYKDCPSKFFSLRDGYVWHLQCVSDASIPWQTHERNAFWWNIGVQWVWSSERLKEKDERPQKIASEIGLS